MTAGQARPLLGLEDPAAARRSPSGPSREGLSARALEALAGDGRPARKGGAAAPPEPNAAAAAERLTQRLQTQVEIERRGRGGVIRIHFHSEEELMRLFDLLHERGAKP